MSGSTSTACAVRCPPAPSARCLGRTRTARWPRCRPSTSARRWGAPGVLGGQGYPHSHPHAHPLYSQSELSDGIAMLVAGNDRIQAIITQMEEICHTIEVGTGGSGPGAVPVEGCVPVVGLGESSPGAVLRGCAVQPLTPVRQENGRRQKQHVGLRFDALYGILEERKKELLQSIAAEQEAKLQRVRGLIRQYGDHLETSSKLVESAIQAMEEPQMAVYLQVLPEKQGEEGTGGWDCVVVQWFPEECGAASWVYIGGLCSPKRICGCPWDVQGWTYGGGDV